MKLNFSDDRTKYLDAKNAILRTEQKFLTTMEDIVYLYEKNAKAKIEALSFVEIALTLSTIFILVLEAIFILRPVLMKMNTYVGDIKDKNEQLILQEEELKQNLEELNATQEHIKEKYAEVRKQTEKQHITNNILNKSISQLENIDEFLQYTVKTLSEISFLKKAIGVDIFIKNQNAEFELKASINGVYELEANILNFDVSNSSDNWLPSTKSLDMLLTDIKEKTSLNYCLPIKYKNKNFGLLVVYLAQEHQKNTSELRFLENIVAIIANTIDSLEANTKIINQNAHLTHTQRELKHNVEELRTTQETLEKEKEKLKVTLAENVSINNALAKSAIVSLTDLTGSILYVNDIFCEVSGYTREELIGKNQNIVSSGYHPSEFWAEMWQEIKQGNTWRAEIKNQTKDGGIYWVDSVINPMCDKTGKIYRYLSIRYLITDKKESEIKLKSLHKHLTSSVEYSKQIQKAVLVEESKVKEYFPESFIFLRPKDIVSGDFYFFSHRNYKSIIAAVDCTGHGIPGAFMSLITHSLLHEIVNNNGITEPDRILEIIREKILEILRQKETNNQDGLDIAICSVDQYPKHMEDFLGVRQIKYAGTNPLIYFQDNKMHFIKGDKIIIGGARNFQKENKFTKHSIPIKDDTTFYLYSDGIQDQFGGERGKKFTSKRLKDLLSDLQNKGMERQKVIVQQTLDDWQNMYDSPQTDDMILIGVKSI